MTLPAHIETVGAACAYVLTTPDPPAKLMAARAVARAWRLGRLAHRFETAMPDVPARPAAPALLPPNQMPRRGRIGSERSRIAMIHALAHIEFVAIDLAFDLIGRFGSEFPAAFTGEWMQVGAEEAMHFALLDRRLRQMGSHYGALPAHDGLWDAARETAGDALARLAIVPMVLEARALEQILAPVRQKLLHPSPPQPLRPLRDDPGEQRLEVNLVLLTCGHDHSSPSGRSDST